MKPITIVGAGNGGCAMAADLTLRGFDVRLCEVYNPSRIDELRSRGGIELSGAAGDGFATPKLMTAELEEAISGVDLIIWAIPANGREFHVRHSAPFVKPGQTLILMPGAVGGALCVRKLLRELGVEGIQVGETCTLPYGCRLTGPTKVAIYDVAKDVLFAMLPDRRTSGVLALLKPLLPNLIPGETVLDTSLNYMNMLLHPVGMILNAGWVEHRRGDFAYYYDGISPAVALVLEKIDSERLDILKALGLKTISFVEWFFRRGKTESRESVYDAIHKSRPNRNFRAPENLQHRFLLEDVPFGLAPVSHFGRFLHVPTPVTDSLILLASTILQRDLLGECNLETMGIEGMSPEDLKQAVTEGRLT